MLYLNQLLQQQILTVYNKCSRFLIANYGKVNYQMMVCNNNTEFAVASFKCWFTKCVYANQGFYNTIETIAVKYYPAFIYITTGLGFTKALFANTLRPRQNGCHFADDIFKIIFFNENCCTLISWILVSNGPVNKKPLSEQWWQCLLMNTCVTRPQCLNFSIND